ncbi:6990_t:CDS:2 [Cetraspora pellucida]|uniref:6990_t:CDS:1 n=1 Tax=Cetraspora pellucida TaxID=1433469 RepID=A0A9N9ENT9_9GLOM|nr:6990_t:CDS:2 [Cetraspora pellucida]
MNSTEQKPREIDEIILNQGYSHVVNNYESSTEVIDQFNNDHDIEHYEILLDSFNKELTRFYRMIAYTRLNELDNAFKDVCKLLEDLPDNISLLLIHMILSRIEANLNINKFQTNLKDISRLLENDPNNVRLLMIRGLTYMILVRYQESLDDFTSALEIEQTDLGIRLELQRYCGIINQMMCNYKAALYHFNESLKIRPGDKVSLSERAKTYKMLNRYEESIAEIESINNVLLEADGIDYYSLSYYERSLIDLNKALEVSPHDRMTLARRADVYRILERDLYRKMDRNDESLKDFIKALNIEPSNKFAQSSCIDIFRASGEYDKHLLILEKAVEDDDFGTLDLYDELLKSNPNDAFIKTSRVFAKLHLCEKSFIDLNKVLTIDPNNAKALEIRGLNYLFLGKIDDAFKDPTQSLEIDANNPLALSIDSLNVDAKGIKGVAMYMLKLYNNALENFNEALKLDPDNYFCLAYRGALYLKLEKYDESEKDIDKAIELMPDESFLHWQRGALYSAKGQYESSLEEFSTVDSFKSKCSLDNYEHAEAFYNRGILYKKLGKHEESIRDMKRALNLEPGNDLTIMLYEELNNCKSKDVSVQDD